MLSGSHLHTVGCNKESRSDYAGSFLRIAAPASAVCMDTMIQNICWWLVISHIIRDIREDKSSQTRERIGFLGCALSRVVFSLNLVAPI